MSAEPEPSSDESNGHAGGPPNAKFDSESDGNSWVGYALVVVLVGTLVLGLLRPFYPTASALAIGSFLGLFGLLVGFLAFRERSRDS